jgi:hypothetical protein
MKFRAREMLLLCNLRSTADCLFRVIWQHFARIGRLSLLEKMGGMLANQSGLVANVYER